jgi:hypothetical protein
MECEQDEKGKRWWRDNSCLPAREGGEPLSEEITKPHPPAPGRYLSLVVHLWVSEDGELLRGTIADAHTGKRLAIDLSALAALLRESLAQAPGQGGNAQDGGGMTEERPAIET